MGMVIHEGVGMDLDPIVGFKFEKQIVIEFFGPILF
jgi:hypothetical protein